MTKIPAVVCSKVFIRRQVQVIRFCYNSLTPMAGFPSDKERPVERERETYDLANLLKKNRTQFILPEN